MNGILPPEELWEQMSPLTKQLAQSIAGNVNGHCNDKVTTNVVTASATTPKDGDEKDSIHPRVAISRAITMMESKHPFKKKQGDLLLTYLLSLSSATTTIKGSTRDGQWSTDDVSTETETSTKRTVSPTRTLRVGIAGPPGAGKSTLTEAFGMYLLRQDPSLKLAVVCIDPSSNVSGGSILGDKTRMTELARHDRALIRPSSNSGVLGGLSAYTDDVVRLLGCAGYPLVLVETVGLGQSEIEVAQSVDVLVLALPPSGGDDLQGVKKGIVEMANIMIVTKADGDLEPAANRTASDYSGALRVLQMSTSSRRREGQDDVWVPPVLLTSSVTKRGLDDLWNAILDYQDYLLKTGKWEKHRHSQAKYWMWKQFTRMMQMKMQQDPKLAETANRLETHMLGGYLTPRVAAQALLDEFFASAAQRR
jgi:LAO/AO transport system kinase